MEKKQDHLTIGQDSFRCLNCGDEYKMAMPCSITMFAAMGKAFRDDHVDCKPSARGKARMEASDPYEWRRNWDTGLSSITIWDFMMHGCATKESIPYDPSDFGRCYRLLAKFPLWRQRLPEMGDAFPQWKPFVNAWPQMEALYEEELKNEDGCAPKLYELMRKLVDESRR